MRSIAVVGGGPAGFMAALAAAEACQGSASVTVFDSGVPLATVLRTGISGPLAFRVSARCAFRPISREDPLPIQVSVLPGLNGQEIEKRLLASFTERPRRQAVSAVRALVPRSLAEIIVPAAGLSPETAAGQVSRDARKRLSALLDRLPLTIVGREAGSEMVTAGGIPLAEIDPRTMASRRVAGLSFCGEILDIDGFTGGFNLQAAWTTGHLAGLAAGR